MNDYLSTLAIRALRPAETLQPRRSGMFEPSADPFGPDAVSGVSGRWAAEREVAPAVAGEEPAAASWQMEGEPAASGGHPQRAVDRIVAPPPPSEMVYEGDERDGVAPAGAVRSGEMAAEDVPGRVRSQRTEPLFRSHDIPSVRDDGGDIGRDTGIVPQAHGTGAAAERSGRFLKLPGYQDASVPPPSEPKPAPVPSPGRMEPAIAAAGREMLAGRERGSLYREHYERGADAVTAASVIPARITGSLRAGDAFSAGEPSAISSPAPVLPERRLMPVSVPAGADQYQMRNEPPVVRVTIGRIEVRAIMPQAPSRPDPPARKRGPGLSLDDYLRSQKRGGR